jgi:putative ABC transport system permease protein
MNSRDILANAFAALLRSRRRSLTTLLSLAWAVACFLLLMSSGQGFDRALRDAFHAVGQDLVLMYSGQTSEQKGGMRAGRWIPLQLSDVDKIREEVPMVGALSPELTRDVRVVYGNREKEYRIRAVRPEYQQVRNIQILSGRWINAEDGHNVRRVAVLGATVAEELLGNRSESGQEILIEGVRFTVIGRMKTKLQIANYSRPDNECIFVPYDTVRLFVNIRYPEYIVWTPAAPPYREQAIRQVRATLAGIHRFSATDEKAVGILAFSQYEKIIDGVSIAFNALMVFIGAITLGIGAIGLANIMLTSVIERTREIGIMMALGARRRSILRQFLLESILIVLAGGMIGVIFALAAASMVGSLPALGALVDDKVDLTQGRIYFHISAVSIAVSLSILLLVGLLAGMFPAIRASRLDPVKALHYE